MSFQKVQRLRDAVTKTAKLLARDKIEVTQRGGQPNVKYRRDGSVEYVNLPMIPENPSPEFMDALQGFLDHEVAHVLFTDHKAAMDLMEKAASAERLDVARLGMLQNIFEDIRIEKRMRAEFQGSAYNLSKALESVLAGPISEQLKAAAKMKNSVERSAARVMYSFVAWVRALTNDATAKVFMDENGLWADFEPLMKAMPDIATRLNGLQTTAEATQLAIDFLKALSPPPPAEPEPEPGEEGEEDKDNPSLGRSKDGTSDDDAEGDDAEDDDDDADEDPDGDDEGEGGKGEDDDADEGEGAGGGEDETDSEKHKADEDAPEDGTPDDHETDGDADSDGDDPDGDGDDDGDWQGDSDFDGEVEEDAEGKTNRSLTEAMRLLEPTHRKLITDYNKKKKSVDQIASERGVSSSAIASELKEARRNLKRFMKGAM